MLMRWFYATDTLFWKLLQMLNVMARFATVDCLFALASVVKLFTSQRSPVSDNQDLTVVLASHACPREVRAGHEKVFVRFRTLTAEIIVGSGSKLNVKMSGSGLRDFFSVKRQASLLHSLRFALLEGLTSSSFWHCWKFWTKGEVRLGVAQHSATLCFYPCLR